MAKTFLLVLIVVLPWGVQADPTRPPGWGEPASVSAPAPDLQLQQIVHDGREGVAVINNQLVRRGDQLEGLTVLAIQPDRVVLRLRNQRHELLLNKVPDLKRKQP